MRIQHNIMAMNAYRNYTNNTSALAKNLEKLSSGYRINRAGDDAAGLAISEKMRAQITGLDAAQKNVKDGISLVKTAEGATQEIHDMLNRMVYLATQSANGTYQDEVDREAITNEFEQLKSEINRIADSANFNGIKLLDGSLDDKAATTKVEINGIASTKSVGSKGKYTNSAVITASNTSRDGDTYEFTASLEDGTSQTVKLTLSWDDSVKKNYLVAEDGTRYDVAATTNSTSADTAVVNTDLDKAFAKELEKGEMGKSYNISVSADGKITMEAKDAGTEVSKVKAFDFESNLKGTRPTAVAMGVTEDKAAMDEGREIVATAITKYNGKNYDDAVFTINGHKFVVTVGELDASDLGKDGTSMNATMGLGDDVTILISDGANNGLDANDANFDQNIKKIAEVTGLTVTKGIDEANQNPAGTTTGATATSGIRLSAGKGNGKNGLTLQIGDTAEDFNQLKVSIADMHTKALGLDKLSLGTQKGAQDAVAKIKDAINSVSQTRGTLGATQNRLEHTQNNLSVMKENIQDAESTIRDTDVAEEMMAYTKNNILVQSAQAMLAQANQIPQGVLQLLG